MALDSSIVRASYTVDYTSGRFYLPVPGQICYFCSNLPYSEDDTYTESCITLVKCISEARKTIINSSGHKVVTLMLQLLSDDGSAKRHDYTNLILPPFQAHVQVDVSNFVPIGRPWFVRAKEVILNEPPTLSDVFNVAAYANAKCIEIQQQLAVLTSLLAPTAAGNVQETLQDSTNDAT